MSNLITDEILGQLSPDTLHTLRNEHLNSMGNYRRLSRFTEGNHKYVSERKEWIVFTKGRWKKDVDSRWITRCYCRAMELTQLAAMRDGHNALEAFANNCLKNNTVESDLKFASKQIGEYPISSNELDKDPFKLGTPSGVIDLKTGKEIKVNRAEYITKSVRVDFDPSVRCSLWEDEFLPSVCMGRKDLIQYLKLLAGYMLTGDVSEEMIHFLYGGGRNGKGTFTGTLAHLMNDYYFSLPSDFLESKKFGSGNNMTHASQLQGIRFALTSETGGNRVWDMERINDLTGGDTLPVRALYQNTTNIEPTWTLVVHGNGKPRVNTEGEGFWARMALVPFDASFIDAKSQIPNLKRDLKTKKAQQGILSWAVEGCLEWQKMGLKESKPQCILDATREFRSDSDRLKDFYEQECVFNPDFKILKQDLWNKYHEYCEHMHIPAGRRFSLQNFYKKILQKETVREAKITGFRYFKGVDAIDNIPLKSAR